MFSTRRVAAILGLATLALAFPAFAWTGPSASPPNGNVSGPVDISATAQSKAGNLTAPNLVNLSGTFQEKTGGFWADGGVGVNGGSSGKLCIASWCLTSWADLATSSAVSSQWSNGAGGVIYYSGGNVALGKSTTASYAQLDVNTTGNKAVHTLDTANGGLLIGYQGATIQGRTTADANGNLYLNGYGGNVAVGAGSAPYTLSINGIGWTANRFVVAGGGASNGFIGNALTLGFDGTTGWIQTSATGGILSLNAYGGYVGINQAGNAPLWPLTVAGDIHAYGYLTVSGCFAGDCMSDERVKTDVHPFTLGLSELLQINPVYYRYNGLGGTVKSETDQIGVIAQNVAQAAPQLITYTSAKLNPNDTASTTLMEVDYTYFPFMTINAIKDLDGKITSQQQEIDQLKQIVCVDHPSASVCQ